MIEKEGDRAHALVNHPTDAARGCGFVSVNNRRQRIVVKIGSSSLTEDGGQLSYTKLEAFIDQMAKLYQDEHAQIIVVSSGAVALGMAQLGWRRSDSTMPEKQAAAAVGQSLLMQAYQKAFAGLGIHIAQLLLTKTDIEDRKRFVNIRNTMETLLYHGIIPIINENDTVAVEEIRFGDNDTLSSFVAMVADADLLVLLTDVDGLYSTDPRTYPDAKKLDDVWQIDAAIEGMAGAEGSDRGTGGMRTKVAAAKIATGSGVNMVLAASTVEDVLVRVVRGEKIGTRFHARPGELPARKSWLMYGTRPEGRLVVDDGAARALLRTNGSLLLPGIVAVQGDFQEGAIVSVERENGLEIAKGLCNFSAWDLRVLIDRRQQGESLRQMQEAVHRNQLVLAHQKGGKNRGIEARD